MQTQVLHHASIQVTDLGRAREFYEQTLGLTPIERPELGVPGVWYGLGGGQLHLIQCERVRSATDRERINPTDPHFAITVDVTAARAKLNALGVPILDLGDQMWVLDPDGNTVELRTA
jgi:catechol 2,3-dioxygenase-like lactoylglutathione lyase family enzyme